MIEAFSNTQEDFTFSFKLKVIEYANNTSNREAARAFQLTIVSDGRVRYWKKQKEHLNKNSNV